MATFLIERTLPGAAQLTPEQLRDIARTSNEVVDGLGVAYTWHKSYVAGDKIYCLHEALGIEATEDDEPRAEQAYLLLIEGRPLPVAEPSSWWHRPAARWTCTSCGQRITDHGPFESHPDDVEEGHTGSCARRAATLAAYRKESW